MLWFSDKPLLMPDPLFPAEGVIEYACPLGCLWRVRYEPPCSFDLDRFVKAVRHDVSLHYQACHGVVRIEEE